MACLLVSEAYSQFNSQHTAVFDFGWVEFRHDTTASYRDIRASHEVRQAVQEVAWRTAYNVQILRQGAVVSQPKAFQRNRV